MEMKGFDDVLEIRRNGEDWVLITGTTIRGLRSPSRSIIDAHILKWAGPMANRLVIRNDDELKAAIERACQLMGCTNGSDEERELAEIADAVEVYEVSSKGAANDPAGGGQGGASGGDGSG